MSNKKKLKITLVRSLNGRIASHKACAQGLGLKRIHQTVEIDNTPEIVGMVNKINYLLKIEKL